MTRSVDTGSQGVGFLSILCAGAEEDSLELSCQAHRHPEGRSRANAFQPRSDPFPRIKEAPTLLNPAKCYRNTWRLDAVRCRSRWCAQVGDSSTWSRPARSSTGPRQTESAPMESAARPAAAPRGPAERPPRSLPATSSSSSSVSSVGSISRSKSPSSSSTTALRASAARPGFRLGALVALLALVVQRHHLAAALLRLPPTILPPRPDQSRKSPCPCRPPWPRPANPTHLLPAPAPRSRSRKCLFRHCRRPTHRFRPTHSRPLSGSSVNSNSLSLSASTSAEPSASRLSSNSLDDSSSPAARFVACQRQFKFARRFLLRYRALGAVRAPTRIRSMNRPWRFVPASAWRRRPDSVPSRRCRPVPKRCRCRRGLGD